MYTTPPRIRDINASPAHSHPGLVAAQAPVPRSNEGLHKPHAPHTAAEHTARCGSLPLAWANSTPGQLLGSTTPLAVETNHPAWARVRTFEEMSAQGLPMQCEQRSQHQLQPSSDHISLCSHHTMTMIHRSAAAFRSPQIAERTSTTADKHNGLTRPATSLSFT